jgi:hypothetical protein
LNKKFLPILLAVAVLLGGAFLMAPQLQQKASAAINNQPITYPISAGQTGQSTYSDFLNRLRQRVTGGRFLQGDTLRTDPAARDDFTIVQLGAGNEGAAASEIMLLVRNSDLFVVGWLSRSTNRFTSLENNIPTLNDPGAFGLPAAEPVRARFSGNYVALERRAGQGRSEIGLSPDAVRQSIRDLDRASSTEAQQARALIVLIQVVAEGARFRPIEQLYRGTYINGATRPEPHHIALENAWDPVSEIANRHVNNPNDPLTQELMRRHENFLNELEIFQSAQVSTLLAVAIFFTSLG